MNIENLYNLPVQNLALPFFDDEEIDQVPDWLMDRMNLMIDSILGAVSKDSLRLVQSSKVQTIVSLSEYFNQLFNYYDKQFEEYEDNSPEELAKIVTSKTLIILLFLVMASNSKGFLQLEQYSSALGCIKLYDPI